MDGGVPATIREHGFFAYQRRLRGVPRSGPVPLRSVFPSSTAPAHASFLTGVHPGEHGIIGNRFFGTESAEVIRGLAANPYLSVHPYESSSMTAPSLVDWFAERDARQAAVHFPQTFSRDGNGIPSLYCLYAPARQVQVEAAEEHAVLTYFGHDVHIRVTRPASEQAHVEIIGPGSSGRAVVGRGAPARVDVTLPIGELSVPVSLGDVAGNEVRLLVGTAVLVIKSGGIALPSAPGAGPSSLELSYPASTGHDFHESPRAEWVRDTVLHAVDAHRPHVLFARFNQADHAQEFLHWHAVRAGSAESAAARTQILDTYSLIDNCIGEIIGHIGADADYVFFSDHGIDYVETHLAPNAVLADLGLADRFVFQGDSNVAYLYGERPPSPAELTAVVRAVCAVDDTIQPMDQDALRAHLLWTGSPRTGHFAISCGAHREFVYSPGSGATERVRSASHGYFPSHPAMSGFFNVIGPGADDVVVPTGLVDTAAVVRRLWSAQEA
nr:alkaline phosphatase family protein [Lentzea flaviverrucosa]